MSQKNNVRIELFFKDDAELRERVNFLAQKGITSFNLVNKNRHDRLEEWINIIHEEVPDSSVCAHFSLKYNKSGKRVNGDDASYGIFSSFVQSICTSSNSNNNKQQTTEVLLISGSGKKSKLDSINTLKRLQQERKMFQATTATSPKIGIAFNPFFPSDEDLKLEQDRLLQKLRTNQVDKVYLQFGSNLERLRSSLQWLSKIRQQSPTTPKESHQNNYNFEICASIFLPTPKLIAQQKFRPWNGVYLCDEFLSSSDNARQIVLQMMKLYKQHDVEILIEAPGVRNEKDMKLVQDLLQDCKESESFVSFQKEQINNSGQRKMKCDHNVQSNNGGVKKEESMLNHNDDSRKSSIHNKVTPSPLVSVEALQKPAILLFGSFDVRMHDNRAVELASCHSRVIPVFLWSSQEQGQWGVTGALQVVLKDALRNLRNKLESHGLQLVCRNTDNTAMELATICSETGASAVYWNKEHTTESRQRDTERKRVLAAQSSPCDIIIVECQSSLLYDPEQIKLSTGFNGGHWGTLMPFLKGCQQQFGEPRRPSARHETFAILESMKGPNKWPSSIHVDQLDMGVVHGKDKWDKPILDRFPMSEEAAFETLKEFFTKGFTRYEKERSRADLEWSTSKLSAHLRIGTLSPNELYHKTHDSGLPYEDTKTFSRRLIWRDLAYYQLYTFPSMRDRPIRKHYEDTEWVTGDEERRRLEAWKWGKTGYPIVDAGMRELYATGWMTQSVRMIVASFLVEYLRVNWVKGCEWFHYTLVDADSAINAMMWNNAGRSGIDQWNFVLSPENASQDGTGEYTKKWVPELAALSKPLIHKPWQAPKEVLERVGIVLGKTYPHRIVKDLKEERQHSIDSVLKMRRNAQEFNDRRGYDLITLPNGENTVVFTKKEYRIDVEGNLMKSGGNSSNRVGKSKRRRKR